MHTIVYLPVLEPSSFINSSRWMWDRMSGPKYDGCSWIVFSSSLRKNMIARLARRSQRLSLDALGLDRGEVHGLVCGWWRRGKVFSTGAFVLCDLLSYCSNCSGGSEGAVDNARASERLQLPTTLPSSIRPAVHARKSLYACDCTRDRCMLQRAARRTCGRGVENNGECLGFLDSRSRFPRSCSRRGKSFGSTASSRSPASTRAPPFRLCCATSTCICPAQHHTRQPRRQLA